MNPLFPKRSVRKSHAGFTLVEAVLSTLIIAMVATSALRGLGICAKASRMQVDRWRGYSLARQLLEEIRQTAYVDPAAPGTFGPETNELRTNYDDVDDYNGVTESPPTSRSGVAIAGYTGWRRTVSVAYVNATTGAIVASDSGVKQITITVTSPRGVVSTLVALRSAYSGFDHVTIPLTTYTSWASVNVQVGTDSTSAASSGATLSNQVP
jgi:MSHA pilin protein MshD